MIYIISQSFLHYLRIDTFSPIAIRESELSLSFPNLQSNKTLWFCVGCCEVTIIFIIKWAAFANM